MNADSSKLFSKYVDGTLSTDEQALLDELLSKDEALRGKFLEYMRVCSVLEEEAHAGRYPAAPGAERPPRASQPRLAFVRFARATAGIAAAFVLAFSIWHLASDRGPAATRVQARVVALQNVAGQGFAVGDRLSLDELQIHGGWLRLELPKGVLFDIYGPARGQFETDQRFRLDSGRLNVDVGPLGKGFTVVTDSAEVVDLGTQFGVEVGDDANAKVAVFSGEVEVHSSTEARSPKLLAQGEGIQVASGGIASRLMSINIADSESEPSLGSIFADHINISDNFTSEESLRFYGILSNGMREGVNSYTTLRSVRWTSDEGKPFPSELSGADLVQTFHKDRSEKDLSINLDVKTPSRVYVLFDERYPAPSWLTDTFSDTGSTLRSGPWRPVKIVHDILPDPQGYFYVRYKIWSKDIAPGDTLTLGESKDHSSNEHHRAMYGIAVKPLSSSLGQLAADS